MTVPPFEVIAADERFGQLVRRRRRELGMTQLQLAVRVGVASATVGMWEREVNLPVIRKTIDTIAVNDLRISQISEAIFLPVRNIEGALKQSIGIRFYVRKDEAQCGTYSGHSRHYRRGEVACADCRDVYQEYQREYKHSEHRLWLPVQKEKCGTTAGYDQHRRRKEVACDACQKAVRNYSRKRRRQQGMQPMREAQCGTVSGYNRHRRLGEPACAECTRAVREANRLRQRLKGILPAREAQCGTYSGYMKHYRNKDPACDECKTANREYHRQLYQRKKITSNE